VGEGCGVCAESDANNIVASARMEANRRTKSKRDLLQVVKWKYTKEKGPKNDGKYTPWDSVRESGTKLLERFLQLPAKR
jgi:hypothetical protein